MMIFIDVEPNTAVTGNDLKIESDLTSLIGLAGDIRGLLGIYCSQKAAQDITSAMLGMDVDELNEDVKDAIGEIANMIAGGVKECLAAEGQDIQLAIPTTATGKSLRTSGIPGGLRMVIPFSLADSTFHVELKYVLS